MFESNLKLNVPFPKQATHLVRSYNALIIVAVLFLCGTTKVFAQLPPSVSDDATVSLLTIFPGEPVYSAWGHSALRFQDPANGLDASFNWGTFDTTVPYFIPRFAYGDMQYRLSAEPTDGLRRAAVFQEREMVEQILALSPTQVAQLYGLVLENLKPENRTYLYDFVYDNCSTRILDLLFAVEGIVLPNEDVHTSTFRQMIDEFVHDRAALDLGIDLVFGVSMDQVPTLRQRTFLPTSLMATLDQSLTPDNKPIVRETNTLLRFDHETTPPKTPWTIWVSLFLSVALGLLSWFSTRFSNVLDRLILGVFGFIGLFFLIMWFATLHHVTAWNLNILWALPVHLWIAVRWTKLHWLTSYFKITFWWTLGVFLIQFALPQHIPPAALPLAVLVLAILAKRHFVQPVTLEEA